MAVEKNFVVKNGLEVNERLLVVNKEASRVGVNTYAPAFDLEVVGGIGATDLYVGSAASIGLDNFMLVRDQPILYLQVLTKQEFLLLVLILRSPAYVLDVQGPVSTGQTALFVHGDTYITGTLNVGTGSSTGSDIIIDGNLEIIGISTFENHVDINNTLNVIGFSTFNNVSINTSLYCCWYTSLTNLYVGWITFVGFVTFNDSIMLHLLIPVLTVSGINNISEQSLCWWSIYIYRCYFLHG